ncbi:hypothetical protein [Mesorhizobium sp. SP-1A]|uniref:hypothetical protein n=1 Tax=Mesorhizobium sp. SP-1A TaxID=3077840 RepID=UPI0028F72972|nr:hypothetical protein [Mesorhizobium sp. SP-1A]
MHLVEKAIATFLIMLLFVCGLFAWRNHSEPDVPVKSYAKANTFVVASEASFLRYRAKAHTAVTESVR